MKRFAKVISVLIASVLTLAVMIVPAAADTTKTPYVRSWLDAMSNYTVIDYYEYNESEGGYMKTSTVNYVDANAYYKTSKTKLSDALYDEQIGFDVNGNVLFINTDKTVYGVLKNGNTAQTIASNADELAYDNNGFVIGYYSGGNLINITSPTNSSNNNTNSNNNTSNTNNSGSNNTSWNAGSSSNGWNTNSGTNNNNSTTTNGSFPYITTEDGNLVFVEASDIHNVLYVEDNHLIINNIILYKHGVKAYGFTKDGVVYITNANKVVVWKFATKKQYVVAKKVTALNTDNTGFVVSYTTKSGKTVSL